MTDTIETKRHAPIVYSVYHFFEASPDKVYPPKKLCHIFWGEFTKSLDTAMRNIVEEIVNDRTMKLIVSTRKGYMMPSKGRIAEVEENIRTLEKTARALFYRRGSLLFKLGADLQQKLQIGDYDKPEYQAFLRRLEENAQADGIGKSRKYKEAMFDDSVMQDTPTGQRGFSL